MIYTIIGKIVVGVVVFVAGYSAMLFGILPFVGDEDSPLYIGYKAKRSSSQIEWIQNSPYLWNDGPNGRFVIEYDPLPTEYGDPPKFEPVRWWSHRRPYELLDFANIQPITTEGVVTSYYGRFRTLDTAKNIAEWRKRTIPNRAMR